MTTNFAVLCRRCWDNNEKVIDDCCVHQVDQDIIMYRCHNCGYEEYVSEKKRFVEDDKLRDEKKQIERILKLKKRTQRRSN